VIAALDYVGLLCDGDSRRCDAALRGAREKIIS
jgi:hypothetical protein